jgi:hypothetical protein
MARWQEGLEGAHTAMFSLNFGVFWVSFSVSFGSWLFVVFYFDLLLRSSSCISFLAMVSRLLT